MFIRSVNFLVHLPIQLYLLCFCRNVLELIQFFEDDNRFYLVFEKLCGGMQSHKNSHLYILNFSKSVILLSSQVLF